MKCDCGEKNLNNYKNVIDFCDGDIGIFEGTNYCNRIYECPKCNKKKRVTNK